MDSIDLSLDDIIKKNSVGKRKVNKNPKKQINKFKSAKPTKPLRIVDARSKIIEKNRNKIKDARDKLVNITKSMGDARLKIIKKKLSGMPKHELSAKGKIKSKKQNGNLVLRTKKNQIIDTPPPTAVSIRRTVQNDMAYYMPPLPHFNPPPRQSQNDWMSDPFDCYVVPNERPDPQQLQRHIRNVVVDSSTLPVKGILRTTRLEAPAPIQHKRDYINSHSHIVQYNGPQPHLSTSMKSRLESTPNPYESVGIFARMPRSPSPEPMSVSYSTSSQQRNTHYSNARSPQKAQQSNNSSDGYRIVVSNLNSMVTQNDIKELFEDIGLLLDARIARPGIAEVIFKSLNDAEQAVETYHNRQLDGQPMKCLLVKPRVSNKPTAPAIKAMYSDREQVKRTFTNPKKNEKAPLEIDIDALHKVLFRRH